MEKERGKTQEGRMEGVKREEVGGGKGRERVRESKRESSHRLIYFPNAHSR